MRSSAAIKSAIQTWVKLCDDEGVKIQAVLANYDADSEAIINVTQGVKLADGTELTPAQCNRMGGRCAGGARINQSNTGRNMLELLT